MYNIVAFPWRIFNSYGTLLKEGEGSLFCKPPVNETSEAYFSSLRSEGWHKCPLGYAVYAKKVDLSFFGEDSSCLLVIGYLKVDGVSTKQGRETNLSIRLSRTQLEDHINTSLNEITNLQKEFENRTRENIHEIRSLTGGLYHLAENLLNKLNASHAEKILSDLCGNMKALSQLLTTRIDLIEYFSIDYSQNADFSDSSITKFVVYAKFDKIVRCFKQKARNNNINLNLVGSSEAAILGNSRKFEMIPYLLIDNAIKYSPENQAIKVEINENNGYIVTSVESIGPHINTEEMDKIFQYGIRGVNAINSGINGSGIGLPVLKKLIETEYDGIIHLNVTPQGIKNRAIEYSKIKFTTKFKFS